METFRAIKMVPRDFNGIGIRGGGGEGKMVIRGKVYRNNKFNI